MTAIVSLNCGSSSIKFSLFNAEADGDLELWATGKIEKIGISPVMSARSAAGEILEARSWEGRTQLTHEDVLAELFDWLTQYARPALGAVGHRVVHGGMEFCQPVLIDESIIDQLERLSPLAPLHQPHNVAAIRAIAGLAPDLPQVACFDTAFHHDKPGVATRFAIPRIFHDKGVRRYGFHGLSYEFIARRLAEIDPKLAAGRVIAAHLGNGASVCAMKEGKSVDTSMGFTALDGLVMGTRCGNIDPGVLLYLGKQLSMTPDQIEDLLYRKSGLLGVSGISSDMRELEASTAPEAGEAIELFAWRAAREIAGLVSSLAGIDAIVFTAGIGENDPSMRRRICEKLEWLGLVLDHSQNGKNNLQISSPQSRVAVLVIPTDEERMIALHALSVLQLRSSTPKRACN